MTEVLRVGTHSYTGSVDTTLLVVDDDDEIRELLADYLSRQGYVVLSAADGAGMRRCLAQHRVDLAILDIRLPDTDGLSLLREIRQKDHLPVVMLTASGEPADRVVGLELGADDYLPKPFEARELLARIRAVLRRHPSGAAGAHLRRFGGFTLDPITRQLTSGARQHILSSAEFRLLMTFLDAPRQVLSRDELMRRTRGLEHDPDDRGIDMQVMRLRRVLEEDPAVPRHLHTVRGQGYAFTPDPASLPESA